MKEQGIYFPVPAINTKDQREHFSNRYSKIGINVTSESI